MIFTYCQSLRTAISLLYKNMSNDFKKNLRMELDYQDLTVKELSAKTGIPKPTLDCYLGSRATMPPADIAVHIAQVLHVTVEYLVTSENKSNESHSNDDIKYRPYRDILDDLSHLHENTLFSVRAMIHAAFEAQQKQECLAAQKEPEFKKS
jgi:transcriptional regulator with XRE-family HTH domain